MNTVCLKWSGFTEAELLPMSGYVSTRPLGLPCRHPELVRPSLEAYGFDISRTTNELFGIELLWGKDGMLPKYLTLVCGFFHNSDVVSF